MESSTENGIQQGNARVHNCKVSLPRPAYSPDLAHSDYILFPNLKKTTTTKNIPVNAISYSIKRSRQRLRSGLTQSVPSIWFWDDGNGTPLVQMYHAGG